MRAVESVSKNNVKLLRCSRQTDKVFIMVGCISEFLEW